MRHYSIVISSLSTQIFRIKRNSDLIRVQILKHIVCLDQLKHAHTDLINLVSLHLQTIKSGINFYIYILKMIEFQKK